MKKRMLVIALLLSTAALFASGIHEAVEEGPLDGIVSIKAITDSVLIGQKLKAVVMEYEDVVDPSGISTASYIIQDLFKDGKSMANATITEVYTNDKPEINSEGQSVEGKYVVIETSETDEVGIMIVPYYYLENGEEKSHDYWLKPEVNTFVKQISDINGTDGSVISQFSNKLLAMTEKTTHLKYDEFRSLKIDSPMNKLTGETQILYYLPESYKDSKENYPMVVVQCGGGLRYWELENGIGNYSANIAFDKSATSWIRNGYEDVIVISIDNLGGNIGMDPTDEYNAPDEINSAVEYFIENFKVNPDRIYYSGNSAGSYIGYSAVGKRPDLYAAFMPCNGLPFVNFPTNWDDLYEFEDYKPYMKPIAEGKVPLIMQFGERDAGASGPKGEQVVQVMTEFYKEMGMTQEEIDGILVLNVYYSPEYESLNLYSADSSVNYHGATKLVYENHKDEFMPWLLSQIKNK